MSCAGSRIALIGAGTIGVGWAIVFARARADVSLYDPDGTRLEAARTDFEQRVAALGHGRLLEEEPGAITARVCFTESLEPALDGAVHVQENAPESLAVKQALFRELDALADVDATLASSSSALTASAFAADLPGRGRCLVAHPGNPPYLLPVVELVPAPFTDDAVVARAHDLFSAAGISPVVLRREIEGFIFNRLQGALLREAYCLVRDGVTSVDDVDRVVRDGLGRRWSVIGPFETAELNTRGGIEAHAAKLGPAYARMGAERGQHDPWAPDLVTQVAAEVHRRLPPARWEERVQWRDDALIALERARRTSPLFDTQPSHSIRPPQTTQEKGEEAKC